jgi:AcrR family transcriptional regulator
MNEIKKDNTEERILKAAHTVFIRKGMDGSRMQEIADEAKINKALLHYYFRSKQKLFEAIFTSIFGQIFPNVKSLLLSEMPLEEKLRAFIEKYIDLLLRNPYLPAFVLKEINRDSDFFSKMFKDKGINLLPVFNMFEREMENGNIRKMDPRELIINMLSLCIFPFAAKPLLKIMLFEGDKAEYNNFLIERKRTVTNFVLNSILIK